MDSVYDVWGVTVVLLVLIGTYLVQETACVDVSWDVAKFSVEQGGSVKLKCKLVGLNEQDIVLLQAHGNTPDAFDNVISEDNFLKSDYRDGGRYFVTVSYDDDDVGTATLLIKDIRVSDAGRYACFRLSKSDERAFAILEVQVPIKSLSLSSSRANHLDQTPIHNGQMAHLQQGDSIICSGTVEGATTGPELQLLLGEAYVTDRFHKTSSSTTSGDTTEEHTVTMTLVLGSRTSMEFNGEVLKCVASPTGTEERSVETTLQIKYAPILECHQDNYLAVLDRQMSVTCDLWSNPPATVHWMYEKQGGIRTNLMDHEDYIGGYHTEQQVNGKDHMMVALKLYKVTQAHLLQYHLEASNSIGSAKEQIQISRASMELRSAGNPSNSPHFIIALIATVIKVLL